MQEKSLTAKRVMLPDSLEAVNRLYYMRGWTDGLPIVPPTEERVREMVAGSGREPDESIGLVPPKRGRATIENVAINAVMAGCLPEYMPVIVTALEAMLEEQFRLYSIQATTHPVAPLVIVNGPIVKELDINYGYNVFGQGWRANATIGRALRLVLMNVGGGIPGILDRATHGQPSKFAYCIAESEDDNPWGPLHVERGFPKETSTVTVVGVESPHNINDHMSNTARGILTTCADAMATIGMNQIYLSGAEPVLVLGPEHAETIAADGWSKADVKEFIFNHARVPLGKVRLGGMYNMRDWPNWYDGLTDDALIPIARCPEDIIVMVAGGAGKHSCCLPNFGITRSVTRAIPS